MRQLIIINEIINFINHDFDTYHTVLNSPTGPQRATSKILLNWLLDKGHRSVGNMTESENILNQLGDASRLIYHELNQKHFHEFGELLPLNDVVYTHEYLRDTIITKIIEPLLFKFGLTFSSQELDKINQLAIDELAVITDGYHIWQLLLND